MAVSFPDLSFPAAWRVDVLRERPLILPRRQHVYPAAVEEVERGALELMVRPDAGESFLATCALGFASPAVPTGVWTCPDAAMLCAVAGGYAYMIDTRAPERFHQVGYRPVTEVRPLVEAGLRRRAAMANSAALLGGRPAGRGLGDGPQGVGLGSANRSRSAVHHRPGDGTAQWRTIIRVK
jgi:hypothetical protein